MAKKFSVDWKNSELIRAQLAQYDFDLRVCAAEKIGIEVMTRDML